jgi:hypothetical protein
MSEQNTQIARVTLAIGPTVLAFAEARIESQRPTFYADDLRRFVATKHTVAPGSADRMLRRLRALGKLGYTLLDRTTSLYRLDWVASPDGAIVS